MHRKCAEFVPNLCGKDCTEKRGRIKLEVRVFEKEQSKQTDEQPIRTEAVKHETSDHNGHEMATTEVKPPQLICRITGIYISEDMKNAFECCLISDTYTVPI